jgi:hypothetical protein
MATVVSIQNFGAVRLRTNGATATYQGLQMRFDTRLSNSLVVNANYTFSRTIDNASEIFSTGPTGFDGTNSFTLGTEFDVHFIIYNLPNIATGIEQRLVTDKRTRRFADGCCAAPGNQMQALQRTRIKVPSARGRYAITVTIRDAKNKIDLEPRSDFVVE